jgi:hypothetical protein
MIPPEAAGSISIVVPDSDRVRQASQTLEDGEIKDDSVQIIERYNRVAYFS